MKKIIPVIVAFVLVGGVVTFLGVGTFKFMDSKTQTNNLGQYSEKFSNPTFKFTGKSAHFKFTTGRALLTTDQKSILVMDVQQTKSIDYLKKETLIIKIRGEEYKKIDNTKNLNSLKSKINTLTFYEEQKRCTEEDSECKNVDVEFPNSSHFKKNFEVGIEYCTNDGKCTYEKFKLSYSLL